MLKMLFAGLLASCIATPLFAGQLNASAQLPGSSLPPAPKVMTAEEVPFVSIAAGYTYLQTDLTNTPGGTGSYQMGWYGIPQVYLTKHVSLIADFTNFYNWHAHQTDNVHGFSGGPAYTLSPLLGVTPFAFVEGGAVRDSNAGSLQWDPAAVGGIGMNLKLTHAVSFQVVPGEYIATKLPNGSWQSNYTAKAGFVFTMFRIKHRRM